MENSRHHTVLVGVGSNIGERVDTCCAAIEKLRNHADITEMEISPFFESDPVGVQDQPPFINLVIRMSTSQTPQKLLKTLKDMEKELGRIYRYRWGPRELDLDILLYEDTVISTDILKIPHPEMHKRAFVLVPACEICPDWEHPILKKSLKQLLSAIPRNGVSPYKGPVPCA